MKTRTGLWMEKSRINENKKAQRSKDGGDGHGKKSSGATRLERKIHKKMNPRITVSDRKELQTNTNNSNNAKMDDQENLYENNDMIPILLSHRNASNSADNLVKSTLPGWLSWLSIGLLCGRLWA